LLGQNVKWEVQVGSIVSGKTTVLGVKPYQYQPLGMDSRSNGMRLTVRDRNM